jgi:hypothetical protein|tara:strand:- start:5 stop:406 length:402 start_codon:yes stop_codon:yes gene_type:complete
VPNNVGYPFDIYREFINMGKFNEISRGHTPRALQGSNELMGNKRLRIIYTLSNQPDMAVCSKVAGFAGKARSQSIALNVVGKPNKVRVRKNDIKSLLKENGATLLFLIGKETPLILRDSPQEVEAKVEWANGY